MSSTLSTLTQNLKAALTMTHSDIDAEDQAYQQDIEAVKQWWTDSRWRYTKRAYTAEQIVQKRGTLKIDYPSNAMSKKLWQIVEGRFAVRTNSLHVNTILTECRTKKYQQHMAVSNPPCSRKWPNTSTPSMSPAGNALLQPLAQTNPLPISPTIP